MTSLLMIPRKAAIAVVALVVLATAAAGGYLLTRDGGSSTKAKPAAAKSKVFAPPLPPPDTPTEPPVEETIAPEPSEKTVIEEAEPGVTAVPAPEGNDGCDHAYLGGCVPWTFPKKEATLAQRCAYLKIRTTYEIRVPGRDRHNLDPDKDKIACNKL